jgi:glycosyltransferase involved in cell wall biosynthesis
MVNLAEGLAGRGHEVAVMFPEPQSFSAVRNGVMLEAVGSISLAAIHEESYWAVFFSRRVRQVFDEFRPEVVHIQDHYPVSVGVVHEARRRGLRVIGTNHFSPACLEPYIPGSRWMQPMLDWLLEEWMLVLYRELDLVAAPSEAAIGALRGKGLRAPPHAVSNGIDLGRFQPDSSVDRKGLREQLGLDPGRALFLYIGRLDKEKGVDILVEAIARLGRDDVQLAIVGHGAQMQNLRNLTHELNVGDRVRFLGHFPNAELPHVLNCADVFTMASRSELLGIACLEAMACGLPVLLSDVFQPHNLCTAGLNGYFFRTGSSEDAARHMGRLVEERERWPAMGVASMENVKSHSLEHTLDCYTAFYQQ